MADPELVAYLRKNRGLYSMEAMRAGLLEQGVDAKELDAAIAEVSAPKKWPRWPLWLAAAGLGGALTVSFVAWRASQRGPGGHLGDDRPLAAPVAAPVDGLAAARERYRRDFFDPYAHAELAERLYRAGRTVDSFYVLEEARSFFAPEAFKVAHAFAVVAKGHGGWGDEPFDASPAHEAELLARVKADPKDHASLGYLAHIAGSRGDEAAAADFADKALALSPDDARMTAFRAYLRLRKNDLPAAFADFDKVARLAPGTPDGKSAAEFLGKVAMGKNDFAVRALESLRRLAEEHPDDPTIFETLAFTRWARGDAAAVRDMVKRALERDPRSAGASAVSGALAIEAKDVDGAVARLKKALEAAPEDRYALEKLAQLYRKEKRDPEGALPYYIALHHLDPDYNDGEFAESRVKEWLQSRRVGLLNAARPGQVADYLTSEDGSLRAEACLRAAKSGDKGFVDALVARLDDDVGIVTQNADYALFTLGKADPSALGAAASRMLASPKPFVRGMALNTLGDLMPATALPAALAGLKDPSSYVRFRAYMSLRQYFAADAKARAAADAFRAGESDAKLVAVLDRLDKPASPPAAPAAAAPEFSGPVKAALALESGDYATAVTEFEAALKAARAKAKPDSIDVGMMESGLGDAYAQSGRPAKAAPHLERAAALLDGPARVHSLYNLACARAAMGKTADAERTLRSAFDAARKAKLLSRFVGQAKLDPELAPLRKRPGWKKLLAGYER